jgi:UDP-2-acetamido-2-deoxy-ribo-hexuluronate aminotransferase
MSGYKINFNGIDRLYRSYNQQLTNCAKKVWSSGLVLTGRDNKKSERYKLENNIAKYTKRKYALVVQCGTDALYFALKAYKIGPGKRVICPAYSFLATSTAIKRTGAEVIFVDVNDQAQIGNLEQNKKIDAVVYVNLFGNLADYKRLSTYCKKNKIPLIEDAAQSFGAFYKNTPSGKLGDISTLSFSPTKNLLAFGNGGAVLTDNEDIAETIKSLRHHGVGKNKVSYGYNSVMPEDHCAQVNFLLSKYKHLQNKRAQVRSWYETELNKIGILTFKTSKDTISSNHKLVIFVGKKRDDLKNFLLDKGIETQIHYKTILPYTEYFKSNNLFPNSLKISTGSLSLPLYPHLTKNEVQYICKTIKEFHGI